MTTIPRELERFLALHSEGAFWESHEVLEGPWRRAGSDFYQGLILYASAWVHWERENAHGVRAQLGKSLERLEGYPAAYLGLDVDRIRAHCRRVRRTVRENPTGWSGKIRPLELEVVASRVRGDEVELGGR